MATAYQLSLADASWIDVNTDFTLNNLPDRIPDDLSIVYASLINLFRCPIGARGKIFQPEYGSEWYQFLQEPIDQVTAAKMQIAMIQAIARWEPRIQLDYSKTSITANTLIPGYEVRIVGVDTLTKGVIALSFQEQAG